MKNKKYVNPRKLSAFNYMNRKGVPKGQRREHCRKFLEYLTKKDIPEEDFTWYKYFKLTEGFKDVFAYYTKEKYGWENATVPKEKYNF